MESRVSNLTQAEFPVLCAQYNIGDEFKPTLPNKNQPVNQPPDGMVGVFVDFFAYGNLRLPLRPFFIQVLKHYNLHICQLVPLAVSKIISFDILCCALHIAPTVDLFRYFVKLAPVEEGTRYTLSRRSHKSYHNLKTRTIRDWQEKFFFVKIEDVMIMRQRGSVSDTKPKQGSYREQDAEILSLYTFTLDPLPQELLWKTGFSNFKNAGDKNPTQRHDTEGAACLLNYKQYVVKNVSSEKYHEEGNVGIDEKLPGTEDMQEDMQFGTVDMQFGTEDMQFGTEDMQFGTEDMQFGTEELQNFDFTQEDIDYLNKVLDSPCEDTHKVKNELLQNYVEDFQSVIHGKYEPREIEGELKKEKQALDSEIAIYEKVASRNRILSGVEYPKKLSQVTALKATEESESVEVRTHKMTWQDCEKPFLLAQIPPLKSKRQEIKTQVENVVNNVDNLRKLQFDEKIPQLRETLRTQQDTLKVRENERQSLKNDVSWLVEEGIEKATKQLMNSKEYYAGISDIVNDAVGLGIAKATKDIYLRDSGVNCTHLESKVNDANTKLIEDQVKLKEVMEPWVTSFSEQKLQELKNEVPKQTLEDELRNSIAHLCGELHQSFEVLE